jgi:hypothetical protein
MEKLLIKTIGRKDLGLGPLVNLTDGGDGTMGYKHSNETKERLRINSSNPKFETREKMKLAKLGRKLSKNIKTKIGLSNLGKHCGQRTKEQKINISLGHKGQIPWNKGMKMDENFCKKARLRQLGKKPTELTIRKRASKLRGKYKKLNDEKIKIILRLLDENLSSRKIADVVGVEKTTILNIKNNKYKSIDVMERPS